MLLPRGLAPGVSSDGDVLSRREESWPWGHSQSHRLGFYVLTHTRALGANAQLKEKMLMNRSCKTIYVLEDRLSGVSGLTLSLEGKGLRQQQPEKSRRKMPLAAGPGLNRKAGLTPHMVWRCRARVNQGMCSANASGRSSCQSSHCPPISKLPLPWPVSLAPCPDPGIPVVRGP